MDLVATLRGLVGLLPVLAFLGFLLAVDSYKLVRLRSVVAVVAAGCLVAGIAYACNALLLHASSIDFTTFSRYVAPVVEEALKAAVVVLLIRGHRIGFLVDAAIFGFAVGAGFAVIENLYYLRLFPDAGLGTWIVRGFGTALMHGGATAIFAIVGLALVDRHGGLSLRALWPGFAVAVLLHSAYNHFFLSPRLSTLLVLIVLPPLLLAVFRRSEQALGQWLGRGFDADAEMLALLNSGALSSSPVGQYLHSLKQHFHGPVVADLLCTVRLHTELALRAKGILMMRESGFEVPVDDETRAKFEELRYLESSIGPTGRLALHPLLHFSRKDLWQLYMLGK